ncbi:MAG: benzoyl-CoA reductase, bzd-type, subunit N [Dehalococcoidia bacterium]|nr:benzoyl-CoA reductase, bzd-type, subunit N [Dehalococcoidia bacterium]
MSQFAHWVENRHEYAREWKKRTGGKVVGCLCTYVPEEILYAANVLPVRIFGGHESSSVVEPHILGMFCPFCRDTLAQGLQGRYDYLDGIVLAQSCLHLRQTFWSWKKHVPIDFTYYLPMPHCTQAAGQYDYLRHEYWQFQTALEKWLGKSITDKDLDRGIEIMDTSRRQSKAVYQHRQGSKPALTGLEAMELVLSSQMVDKVEHNQATKAWLAELPGRELKREVGTRLMIVGNEDDDREFIKMVEQGLSFPATFVAEDHCTGARYFWNETKPNDDRLMAISTRYLDRPACPSKDWPSRTRFDYIFEMAKDYKVEAAILMQQKFCDPHELDMPSLTRAFKDHDIPTYFLEFDVTVPAGQFKVRLEAFLETLVDFV